MSALLAGIDNVCDALALGGFEIGSDYQIRGNWRDAPITEWLDWTNQNVSKPTEQEILAWQATIDSAKASASALQADIGAIKTLAAQAKQHSAKIRLCFEAVVAADFAGENDATRYARYRLALNDASIPNAFRTLVVAAFTSETGLTIDLSLAPATVLISTRQAFNAFVGRFFARWAFMVLIAN